MNNRLDDGFDEVTVIGFQPIAPPPPMRKTSAPSHATGGTPQWQRGTQQSSSPLQRYPLGQNIGEGGAEPNRGFAGLRKATGGAKKLRSLINPRDEKADLRGAPTLLKDVILVGAENAFINASIQILIALAQLREGAEVQDLEIFRSEVAEHIQKFEDRAIRFGAEASDAVAARYILCAVVDETVMTTGWGEKGNWSASSLLNDFHGETWGGEKFFEILDQAKIAPSTHMALIKLIDITLLLGFEGMYGLDGRDRGKLEDISAEVGAVVTSITRTRDIELSGSWKGLEVKGRKLRRSIPIWIIFSVVAALLVGFYGLQQFRLYNALHNVTRQLERVGNMR